jgi:hypothetical protein
MADWVDVQSDAGWVKAQILYVTQMRKQYSKCPFIRSHTNKTYFFSGSGKVNIVEPLCNV